MNMMVDEAEENEYLQFSEKAIRAYFTADRDRRLALKKAAITIFVCFAILGLGWLISLLLNLTISFSYPAQINSLTIFLGVTILLLSITAIDLIIRKKAQPFSDREYDAWLEGTVQKRLIKALDRLDIDKDQDFGSTLYVHGFILPGTKYAKKFRQEDILFKAGKDKKYRYSINTFTYFYPLEHQLAVCIFDINAVNHSDHRDASKEYFYQDIVGVTAEDDHDTVLINGSSNDYRSQSFALRICDGYSISATFHSLPVDTKLNLPTYNISDQGIVEDTIIRLRRLIRFKKHKQPDSDV
jgi:hypothetical protein